MSITDQFKLDGKTALVTGASYGLGEHFAHVLADAGADLVLTARSTDLLEGVAEACRAKGAKVTAATGDVSMEDDVKRVVAAGIADHGKIDVLVNNAGITHACDFLDLAEEDFDRVLAVNLKGVFLAGQAAARQMVKQGGGGAIVNMSSVNAVMAIANQVPYVVSKGAINQLTKVMALALAPHRIRVNGIGPGTILTELAKGAVLGNKEAERKILSRTPLGRMGEPVEVANLAAFLASDEASYLTGQTIYPDGGRLALNYTVPVPE
jgi:NAD(P)-dependent dehydrogenase (short-subunit alcohol dehydrogenase family)